MKFGWFLIVVLLVASLTTASTIRLRFGNALFNNTELIESAKNYSEYSTNLSAPKFTVEGFRIRGEDFILAGQEFFKTYADENGQNITVFELNALVNARVDARTRTLNEQVSQTDIQLEIARNETADAKAQSLPALTMAIQTVAMAGGIILLAYLLFTFIRKWQDRTAPNQTINWSPELEKRKTYEDEIKEAFNRIEQMGGGYGYE